MLAADKSALERELRVSMLQLQWKELQYLHVNFQNLATSSAVLVGFGFAALGFDTSYHPEHTTEQSSVWQLGWDHWADPIFIAETVFQTLFATSAAFALGFNLLSLFIATISSMCGPGMALRGPEGSVSIAVRHMEQQLKRALRFFGRGVVSILLTLTTVGLRNLMDIGFAGGILTFCIGVWTFHALWYYGGDIAEKFHVAPDRAVRGTFIYAPDGTSLWTNTATELAQQEGDEKSCLCFGQQWRPEGHGFTTPLWRLDKFIAFPYYDERSDGEPISAPTSRKAAAGERAQVETLVLNAQGPIASTRMRDDAANSSVVSPMETIAKMAEVVLGPEDPRGAELSPSLPRGARSRKDERRSAQREHPRAGLLQSDRRRPSQQSTELGGLPLAPRR